MISCKSIPIWLSLNYHVYKAITAKVNNCKINQPGSDKDKDRYSIV